MFYSYCCGFAVGATLYLFDNFKSGRAESNRNNTHSHTRFRSLMSPRICGRKWCGKSLYNVDLVVGRPDRLGLTHYQHSLARNDQVLVIQQPRSFTLTNDAEAKHVWARSIRWQMKKASRASSVFIRGKVLKRLRAKIICIAGCLAFCTANCLSPCQVLCFQNDLETWKKMTEKNVPYTGHVGLVVAELDDPMSRLVKYEQLHHRFFADS